jgi:chemotaxis protein CheD
VPDGNLETSNTTYLAPGEVYATAEPRTLKTVLGSCVAVCLYDPVLQIGGMNHFLLPGTGARGEPSSRYGEHAMTSLWHELLRLGAGPAGMRACVFGGARVLAGLSDLMHLGQRNVEYAVEWLTERRVPIEDRNVLGSHARRVEFRVGDGVASVRILGAS